MENIDSQILVEIPKNWKRERIIDFTDATSGGTPNTLVPEYWNGNIRWMNSGELNLKRVYEVKGRISELGLKKSSTKRIPKKCVLIGLAGQGKTRGTVAINYVELCINQSICAILPNKTVDPEFLYHNLDSRYNELRNLSAGEGGRGGLNLTIIRKIPVTFPKTINQQSSIAKVLSDIDKRIQLQIKLIEKKKNIKKGVMQKILSGKNRLEGFSEKWEICRMGDLGKVIRGASPRPKGDKRYYGGDVPRLMVEDVTRDGKIVTPKIDFLTKEGEKRSRPCKKGTLTVVCSGTVGIPSFLAVDACIHDGFLALVDIKKNIFDDYLYHQLSILRNKFETSATHGGIFTNLTTTILEDFLIPIPIKIEEQIAISKILSDMDSEINALKIEENKYKKIKLGVMKNLLSGEIRLK